MKFDIGQYKYSSRFDASCRVFKASDEQIGHIAKASLVNLVDAFNVSADEIKDSPDLCYIVADIFIGGVANARRDAISIEDAKLLAKQVPKKYLNLEHEEKQIVGCLTDYAFRTNEAIDKRQNIEASDIASYDLPFVVSGMGYIWASAYPEVAKLLGEASQEDSPFYEIASLSWEVFFTDYDIMVGSDIVSEAEIVSDKKLIAKMKPFLKQNKGSGQYEGKEIYRLAKGPKIFLGAGLVRTPAANVRGIRVIETESEDDKETTTIQADVEIVGYQSKNKHKKNKNSSHLKKFNVNNNTSTMKIIKDIDQLTKVIASLPEKAEDGIDQETIIALASSGPNLIKEALREASEKYVKDVEDEKTARASAEAKSKELEAAVESLKTEKTEIAEKLQKLEARLAEEETARLFNERMGAIDSEFALDDAASKVVASQIKGLNEDQYTAWYESFKVLASEKSKEAIKARASAETPSATEAEKAEKARLEAEEAEKLIASAATAAADTVPTTEHQEESFADKFASLELELEAKAK